MHLHTIIFISLFCVGLRIASSKGMVLYFLRRPYEKAKSPFLNWLLSPLIGCCTCMASVHSLWIFCYLNEFVFLDWLLCAISVAALNAILYRTYEYLQLMTKGIVSEPCQSENC